MGVVAKRREHSVKRKITYAYKNSPSPANARHSSSSKCQFPHETSIYVILNSSCLNLIYSNLLLNCIFLTVEHFILQSLSLLLKDFGSST